MLFKYIYIYIPSKKTFGNLQLKKQKKKIKNIPIWSCRRWNQWRRRSEYRCRCSDFFFVSLQPFRWASSTVLFLLPPEDTSTPPWWVVFFHTCRSDSALIFTFCCLCFWVMLLWLSIVLIVGSSLSSLLLVTLLDGIYFLSLKLGLFWTFYFIISFWYFKIELT